MKTHMKVNKIYTDIFANYIIAIIYNFDHDVVMFAYNMPRLHFLFSILRFITV